MTLPKFFDRYLSPGLLRRAPVPVQAHAKTQQLKTPDFSTIKAIRRQLPTARVAGRPAKKVVGRHGGISVTTNVDPKDYPISNNIGVAILSFNRSQSLGRLLNSVAAYTDLNRTTVFVCDDASDEPGTIELLNRLEQQAGIVVVRGQSHAGVAVNMNRAFKCLERFRYKLILNDDVEILRSGWDHFYVDAMESTGFHHFCHRQPGIYGAKTGELVAVRDVKLCVVYDKPQGAIFAFDDIAFSAVGYCDESLGMYGMEHVDWSTRVFDAGLQSNGFYDVSGSDSYFRLHNEPSALLDRIEHFNEAKRRLAARKTTGYVAPTNLSAVQTVTCVVPMRDTGRHDTIKLVVNNIRAQRVPAIDIIVVEHDVSQHFTAAELRPARLLFVAAKKPAFNKSVAFNTGVAEAASGMLVLHDADTIVPGQYFAAVVNKLRQYESCHFGQRILYTSHSATLDIVATQRVPKELKCDVVVTYFEGGSLGCWSDVYWRVGGFVEEYCGYGCFLPGNHVLTDSGYRPIEEVLSGSRLYTHEGRFQQAITRTRHYSGNVLDIFVPGRLPIKGVTPEHPFLVQTGEDEFRWKEARDLSKGDVLAATDCMPELVPDYDLDDLRLLSKSHNTFDVSRRMEEFCYLLGLYLADGVIQTPDRFRTLYYYLAEGEEFLARHVETVVHSLHPNIGINYEYVKNGCREVRVFNSLLAKLIYAVAGKFTARDKICSTAFLNARTDRELAFLLGGGCDGDANHNTGSENRIVYHTSSINLAMIYSGVMRRLGVAHSFGRRKGGSFEGSAEWAYDLTVNREFEHIIRSIYPKPPVVGSSSIGRSRFGTVYDVRSYRYDGPVYNFEVEEDHSYVVHGLVVHNCEDCDFYARLSQNSRWCECRDTTFVHLWHDRVDTWRKDHEANKALEQRLQALGKLERVAAARNALRRGPYNRFLTEV